MVSGLRRCRVVGAALAAVVLGWGRCRAFRCCVASQGRQCWRLDLSGVAAVLPLPPDRQHRVAMIAVATTEDKLAEVCGRLRALGARSVEVVAPSDARRVVLAAVDEQPRVACLVASLRAEGAMAVIRPDGGAPLQAWYRDTRPVTFGERLSVCLAWSEHDRRGLPGLIELGAGGFGSGHHPTTQQIVHELVDRIRGGERVLDVGCGSGILGLCAVGLGAATVVAVDVKPAAVEATQRNACLNGLDGRVETRLAPTSRIDGTFDVILANIARAGIVELASELVPRVSPGGWLAAGGLSPAQCSQVVGFLHPLVEIGRRTFKEWSTVVLARA